MFRNDEDLNPKVNLITSEFYSVIQQHDALRKDFETIKNSNLSERVDRLMEQCNKISQNEGEDDIVKLTVSKNNLDAKIKELRIRMKHTKEQLNEKISEKNKYVKLWKDAQESLEVQERMYKNLLQKKKIQISLLESKNSSLEHHIESIIQGQTSGKVDDKIIHLEQELINSNKQVELLAAIVSGINVSENQLSQVGLKIQGKRFGLS
jgi:hypothetical protein